MQRLLPLISVLLLAGCTATVQVDPPNRVPVDRPQAPATEVRIEHVDAAMVAQWAESLRVARAGLARWLETTRGNHAEYMEALRQLSAAMRQYLAGAESKPKPNGQGNGTPSTGTTWGAPPTATTEDAAAVLARGEAALEGLDDD